MKIRQREQQGGRDFDFRFLFFRYYDSAYSVLKCNVHVERKSAEENNVTNTLKEDKLCIRYMYRHNIFRAE
jgi:hypothetical protein